MNKKNAFTVTVRLLKNTVLEKGNNDTNASPVEDILQEA